GAYDHQDVPFEKLVEELAPRRDLGHSPLFQVMLTLQNAPLGALELPGLLLEPVELDSGTAKFDLSLTLLEQDGGMAGWLEYDLDLFDRATAVRIADHFRNLMAGALAEPDRLVSDLPLLTAGEIQQLAAWSPGGDAAAGERCVHELFEAHADRAPRALAVIAEGARLTYGELDERSSRLARYLRRLGVGPGFRVALCVPRSLDGIVGILGILKAGGAYVPLDPSYPRERLSRMLADSGARVLVTREDLEPALAPGFGVAVVFLDGDASIIARMSGERPPRGWALPESLAYVIYTSGSSGAPKGVGVSHAATAGHFRTLIGLYGLGEGDRWLQTSAWSFDMSVEQLLMPLASGAAVVLAQGDLDPSTLARKLADLQVTVLDLTPAVLLRLIRETAGRSVPDLRLRLVIAGGEAMALEVPRLWPATPMAGARLINGYGPTEAVVTATLLDLSATALPDGAVSVPIGRPLAGRSAHVLDRHGLPVPPGMPGELALGGVLARGYLGRPEATAERFVPDSWSAARGARLYLTGDRVRWLASGGLEFLGRVDEQVKIRGFRIELGEIETALRAHPEVEQAAVVVQGAEEARRLAAFLVLRGGSPLPPAAGLRSFLATTLPEYMIPAVLVELPSLLVTHNGKVDRRALAKLAPEPEAQGAYVAPRGPIESALAGIWAEVLRRDGIGATDDFFDLGGHSLLATQVMSRVRQELAVELPLRRLFERPT